MYGSFPLDRATWVLLKNVKACDKYIEALKKEAKKDLVSLGPNNPSNEDVERHQPYAKMIKATQYTEKCYKKVGYDNMRDIFEERLTHPHLSLDELNSKYNLAREKLRRELDTGLFGLNEIGKVTPVVVLRGNSGKITTETLAVSTFQNWVAQAQKIEKLIFERDTDKEVLKVKELIMALEVVKYVQ